MKRPYGHLVLAGILLVFTTACVSRSESTPDTVSATHTVPFTLIDELIVMPISVDGERSDGIIDTGSPVSLLPTRLVSPKTSHAISQGNIRLTLVGNRILPVEFRVLESLDWADHTFTDVVVAVVSDEDWDTLFPPERVVIGVNLLLRACPTFRFEDNMAYLNLHNDTADLLLSADIDASRLKLRDIAIIDGQPHNAVIDTGARRSQLPVANVSSLAVTRHSVGREGIVSESVARIQELRLRDIHIENGLFRIGENLDSPAIIGMDILTHASLSVCWNSVDGRPSHTLRRNSIPSRFPPVEQPQFGFTLGENVDGRFFVVSVIEPSPAFAAGIRPGWLIIAAGRSGEQDLSRDLMTIIHHLANSDTVHMEVVDPETGKAAQISVEKQIIGRFDETHWELACGDFTGSLLRY